MKHFFSKLIFAISIINPWCLQLQANGNGVGNGGDAVVCKPSNLNKLDGYYSLDYLFQLRLYGKNETTVTLEHSLDRIEMTLYEKVPELLQDFQTFRQNLFNMSDPTQAHFWESSNFGLIDIKDEATMALVPENCRVGGEIAVVQAIIRVDPQFSGMPSGRTLFRFAPDVIHEMILNNPLQLSYLLVHEWLWAYSDNADRNRRVNQWLHSDFFDNKPRAEVLKYLEAVGFQVPKPAPGADYSI